VGGIRFDDNFVAASRRTVAWRRIAEARRCITFTASVEIDAVDGAHSTASMCQRGGCEEPSMGDAWHRSCEERRRLEEIPGIGPIVATALVAEVGDWKAFSSGRNLAAWIGLVPKQHAD
jgi:hypothetical protein